MVADSRSAAEVRITVSLPVLQDLTLSYPLDPWHSELLWTIHDHHGGEKIVECRMHDDDPELAHLRDPDGLVRGIWLIVCQHPAERNRLYLRHWPNGPAGPGRHDVPQPMTVKHIKGQEYVAERGQDFGYGVVCNRPFSTENLCRADVRVSGSAATLAAEIQVSKIEVPSVLHRTRRAAHAGATSVWFPMMENPPPWQFKVPCISTNEITTVAPRSWAVTTGVRALEDERCVLGSRFERCPLGKVRHCGGYHPLWVPMSVVTGRRETVDDIVEKLPDGGLVRVDTGSSQGVILATPADREKWLSFQNEKRPALKPAAPRQGASNGVRHSPYSARQIRENLEQAGSREQCHAWCCCTGSHWRAEGDGHRWCPGLGGCSHPRHDEPGLTVWGVSAYLPEPTRSTRAWFWCVLRGGVLLEHGWAAGAARAVERAGVAVGGREAQRCDLVAAEGWRHLAGLARGESDAA